MVIKLSYLQNPTENFHPSNNYNLLISSLAMVVFADHPRLPSFLKVVKIHSRSIPNLQHEKSFSSRLHYSRKVAVQFCTCVTSPQI